MFRKPQYTGWILAIGVSKTNVIGCESSLVCIACVLAFQLIAFKKSVLWRSKYCIGSIKATESLLFVNHAFAPSCVSLNVKKRDEYVTYGSVAVTNGMKLFIDKNVELSSNASVPSAVLPTNL
jgi:hypothetical protein